MSSSIHAKFYKGKVRPVKLFKNFSLPGGIDAWKAAASTFFISRLIILVCTYMAWGRFMTKDPVSGLPVRECMTHLNLCWKTWYQFDVVHFVGIAHFGYEGYVIPPNFDLTHPYTTAFFPLYPLLIRVVGWLFGGSLMADYVAAMLIANIAFFFVLVVLYCLVRNDFDASLARRSLFFLAFNPFAIFFFVGYSESLFLLLTLTMFLMLRRGRPLDWWLAGLCGAGATLTRATGIVLLLVFTIAFLQHFWPTIQSWSTQKLALFRESKGKELVNAFFPMFLIPLGLGVYMLYLWLNWHDPLLFSYVETHHWNRHLDWPWAGIWSVVNAVFIKGNRPDARNVIDLIFTVLPLAILALGWKRIPINYLVFSVATAFFCLIHPWLRHPLASTPRFFMILFPVAIILALWSKNPIINKTFSALWITFFALHAVMFVLNNWVA